MTATSTAEPTTADAVATLVARCAGTSWADLPASTTDATSALVLDALALAAAAPAAPSLRETGRALARLAGDPGVTGGVPVPFGEARPGPVGAATALSVAVHAWDFDDTHDDAVVHTACVALPAALATALECGADGRRLLEGLVSGVEALSRLSLAVGPRPGVVRTAGLGSLGAAAAAARVLGLDPDRTGHALALALPAALAPTSRQVVSDSAVNKRHQPSLAVQAGVTAAYLAEAGVDGPPGWFSGEHGLGRHVGDVDDALVRLATPGWEVERVSLKPFPACRYAHAAVAGTLELTGGVPSPETRVHVRLPEGSHHAMVARPFERRGLAIVDAQFSVPWLVAAALVRGRVGLTEMDAAVLHDPTIEQVARTQVTVAQDQQAGDRVMTPVEVRADGPDGRRVVRLDALPGSPERRLTDTEQREKVRDCLAVGGLAASAAGRLTDFVAGLAHLSADELRQHVQALGAPAAPHPHTHDEETTR